MSSELICPIIVRKPNECPCCGGKLILVNSDITISDINDKGYPAAIFNKSDSKIKCVNCSLKFNVVTDRFGLQVMPAYGDSVVLNDEKVTNNPFQV